MNDIDPDAVKAAGDRHSALRALAGDTDGRAVGVIDGEEIVSTAATEHVVDPVGAGDAFAADLSGRLKGRAQVGR